MTKVLTASEHQKIASLQQISRLLTQAQSVAGNQAVLNNVINNVQPLIRRWEHSDPEFTELGILLRRAKVASPGNPHAFTSLMGQVQRMIAIVRGGVGHKVNRAGEKVVWDPVRGNVTSPMFEKDEPLTINSPHGWRGSKKYPMGKAFPDAWSIEGWEDIPILGGLPIWMWCAIVAGVGYLIVAEDKNWPPFDV